MLHVSFQRRCKKDFMKALEKLAVLFHEMYFDDQLLTLIEKFLKCFCQVSENLTENIFERFQLILQQGFGKLFMKYFLKGFTKTFHAMWVKHRACLIRRSFPSTPFPFLALGTHLKNFKPK